MLSRRLFAICAGALLLRLILLPIIHHPGIGDPNHYYNLGVQLVQGHGFNIDYIWQYNNPPDSIFHPIDHWMPLTGVLAAIPMSLFGVGVHASLLLFILIGAILIPVLTFAAARQFDCSETGALYAAAFAAVLPEFVLNSLRTDTTLPNVVLVCGSIMLLTRGLRQGGVWSFIGSGVLAGLAYLTRNDAVLLLPMLIVTLAISIWWDRKSGTHHTHWRYVILMPVAMGGGVAPWIIRNIQVLGSPATEELSKMFFLTNTLDHFSYGREFTLQTLLAAQTPTEIIGKRLFELAAAGKLMYTTLDIFLPIAIGGGAILLWIGRDRKHWFVLLPTLILLLGILVAYPILIPYKSQAGSFKKAYLTIIPLLIPVGIYAIERAIVDTRIRLGTIILAVGLMGANAVELVRADSQRTVSYLNTMQRMAAVLDTLPDTNDDGEMILMAQDQFMLRFVGVQSVMIPMEDRGTILAVAKRYAVDYILMPADRPSLDPIYNGEESDSRFVHVADVLQTNMKLYRPIYDPDPDSG